MEEVTSSEALAKEEARKREEARKSKLVDIKLRLRQFCEVDLGTSGEGSLEGSQRVMVDMTREEFLRRFDNIYERVYEEALKVENSQQLSQNAISNQIVAQKEHMVCRKCKNEEVNTFQLNPKEGCMICLKCGLVVVDNVMDKGEEKRNFEGVDKNHHAPPPDMFSPNYANTAVTMDSSNNMDYKNKSLAEHLNRVNTDVNKHSTNPEQRDTTEYYKLQEIRDASKRIIEWCETVRIPPDINNLAKKVFAMFRYSREKLKNKESVICCSIAVAYDIMSEQIEFDSNFENSGATSKNPKLIEINKMNKNSNGFPESSDPIISVDISSGLNFWDRDTMMKWLNCNLVSNVNASTNKEEVDLFLSEVESAVLSEMDKQNKIKMGGGGGSKSNSNNSNNNSSSIRSTSKNNTRATSSPFSINNGFAVSSSTNSNVAKRKLEASKGDSFGEALTNWINMHKEELPEYKKIFNIVSKRLKIELSYQQNNSISSKKIKSESNVADMNMNLQHDSFSNVDSDSQSDYAQDSLNTFKVTVAITKANTSKAEPLEKNKAGLECLDNLFG